MNTQEYIQNEAENIFKESGHMTREEVIQETISSGIELAKEFAEWANDNGYTYIGESKWVKSDVIYTTSELFELFLKQKEGK